MFNGAFARIETPKPFKTSLYLRTDVTDKLYRKVLTKILLKRKPFEDLKIQLDSQEFENIFDVYAEDKIVAMQLLTSDIMQMLVEFHKELSYEITIKNNFLYIRFFSGEIFEAPLLNKNSLDKEILFKYYKMLDFIFNLTNKLIKIIDETQYD